MRLVVRGLVHDRRRLRRHHRAHENVDVRAAQKRGQLTVVDACAQLTAWLLGSCDGLRILATSRESLGVSGETVWRLDSLWKRS